MEWTGFIAGLLVGALLGLNARRAGPSEGPRAGLTSGLEDQVEGLRLEWQDTLDKIHHLYDRVRKRLPDDRPVPAVPPVQLNGKDAIRQRAVAAGLWPGRRRE